MRLSLKVPSSQAFAALWYPMKDTFSHAEQMSTSRIPHVLRAKECFRNNRTVKPFPLVYVLRKPIALEFSLATGLRNRREPRAEAPRGAVSRRRHQPRERVPAILGRPDPHSDETLEIVTLVIPSAPSRERSGRRELHAEKCGRLRKGEEVEDCLRHNPRKPATLSTP